MQEYVKGIDLFEIIREIELFTSEAALFYISSIVHVLQYIHS